MASGLANKLVELRKRERLNQATLSDLSGVSRATIGLIERGKSKSMPETLELLAKGLATGSDGVVDRRKATAYHAELFESAGYPMANREVPEPAAPPAVSPSVQERLAVLFERYPTLGFSLARLGDGELTHSQLDWLIQAAEMTADDVEKRSK